ncbi:uncharacterized protein BDZ83DRAFT_120944 [Colletotrichum acutatum]|uniref:Uncharacterized protein n=1 Tax=Glomerella acutata TaxID=27357 RepID=A0AAD8XAD6_GLOAC|nr:uncharacterized protein BDZ83DRAFT_120944 [Colletotrichum acutatum]KAK1711218.1 hypothetical protein BDZ83DRAFT_120944 [Colletotrichum acutatum]
MGAALREKARGDLLLSVLLGASASSSSSPCLGVLYLSAPNSHQDGCRQDVATNSWLFLPVPLGGCAAKGDPSCRCCLSFMAPDRKENRPLVRDTQGRCAGTAVGVQVRMGNDECKCVPICIHVCQDSQARYLRKGIRMLVRYGQSRISSCLRVQRRRAAASHGQQNIIAVSDGR